MKAIQVGISQSVRSDSIFLSDKKISLNHNISNIVTF
jgi:hypothetical protein